MKVPSQIYKRIIFPIVIALTFGIIIFLLYEISQLEPQTKSTFMDPTLNVTDEVL